MLSRPLAALAVLAGTLALPVVAATPAAAAVRTPALAYTDDSGLHRSAPDGSGSTLLDGTTASSYVDGLSASADGSRMALVRSDQVSSGASSVTLRSRIQVRDAGGALVRTADDRTAKVDPATFAFTGSDVSQPALSPDGSTVVWCVTNYDLSSSAVRRAAVAGGGPVTVTGAQALDQVSFVDDTTLMGIGQDGTLATIPLAGGTPVSVAGSPGVDAFAVAPDGASVAYVSGATSNVLSVAPLAPSGGGLSVGTPTVLTSTFDSAEPPHFSQDGATVYWSQYLSDTNTDVLSVPAAGGTPVDISNTPDVYEGAAVGLVLDDTGPAGATALPFTLAGTSAVLHWSLPADADVSGVLVTRVEDGHSFFAPGTSATDTGLTLGATYTYRLVAVDRSGNPSTEETTRQLTAMAGSGSVPDPTSTTYYLNPSFRVTLPATLTYSVQYRTNGTGGLTTWVDHGTGASRVFSTARAGWSYGFLVTVYDDFGNASAPAGIGTAVVPYDQNRASYSGSFVTQALSQRYLGSATILRTAGSAARLVVNGNRLQVIGERCVTCGVMDVYVDGVRIAGVDTHDTQRRTRVVLLTRSLRAGVNHTVVVKARGTAGHPNVVLDGFGVRH